MSEPTDAAMLALPRPTTRGECLEEARPCPWVGCRLHLLLEVTETNRRWGEPATIALNGWSRRGPARGRRPGLASTAAAERVRVWIDEAVEVLSRMPFTCVLDWVDAHGEKVETPSNVVAWLLGVSNQAVNKDERRALLRARIEARRRRTHLEVELDDEGLEAEGVPSSPEPRDR